LTHLWSETVAHKTILRRSREENSSIDPSDGGQMLIFLEKIKGGVEGGKGATSTLRFEQTAGRPQITINITVHLPAGLADLEWAIYLSPMSQSMLTNEFTIPLMEAQYARLQEISSLTQILNSKDRIIRKLLDKFEEQGTQLSQIFPQTAIKGGRKVDRAKAEEKVKDLGPFDIKTWRSGLENVKLRDVTDLVKEIFGDEGSGTPKLQFNSGLTRETNEWWEGSKGMIFDLFQSQPRQNALPKSSRGKPISKPSKFKVSSPCSGMTTEANFDIAIGLDEEQSMQDDDDFQIQATPPRLSSPIPKQRPDAIDNDSTDDDADFSPPSQRSKNPTSVPSPPPTTPPSKLKKLGKLGGKKVSLRSPSPVNEDTADREGSSPIKPSPKKQASPVPEVPAPASKKKGGLGRIGGRKESPLPAKEPTPSPVEQPKPSKGRLGVIGGKKKESTPVAPPAAASESPRATPSPKDAAPVKKKLGAIGGRARTPAREGSVPAEPELPLVARGRSAKVEKEDTPPRETSEERADKKRLELKRELEAKAKAPVKKKRKF
jgi:hypothetical protein